MSDTDAGVASDVNMATADRAKAAGCPHFDGFDPLDHQTVLDPYPQLKRARREVPVFFHLGSAGRDEDVFDDPNTFRLDRPNVNKHLGFGIWAHFCIGAPLARLEAKLALEALLDRLPDLRLAETEEQLDYIDNMILPSVRSMRVAW
jgi:cytochrome P450